MFGADCGSWRGASVDLDVQWRGEKMRVMSLLQGDRVVALRFERLFDRTQTLPQCESRLGEFQGGWHDFGLTGGAPSDPVYDGPVIRAVRAAANAGRTVGTFEGDYRASRGECRVALVITRPTVLIRP